MTSFSLSSLLKTGGDRRSPEWDIQNASGNLVTLLCTQGGGTSAALLVTWLAAKGLGARGYGGLSAVFIGAQLIAVAVEWTGVALWRYGCEEFVESGRVGHSFWTRFTLLLASLAIIIAVSPWLLAATGSWLHIPASLKPLILAYLVVTVFWSHIQRTLQAVKLPLVMGALLALERILLLSSVGFLWLTKYISVDRVALCYICAPLVPMSIAVWHMRPLIGRPLTLDYARLRRMLIFSIPLLSSTLTASLSGIQLDALFLTRYLSLAALGVYALASQIVAGVMLLPLHCGSLLLSFFVTSQTRKRGNSITYYVREILPPLMLSWSIVCIVCAAAGSYVAALVFGPQFASVGTVLWPLMAASVMSGCVTMGYGQVSIAKSATYMSTLTFGISAAINIAMDIILIPKFGIIGCAWATVAANTAGTLAWLHYAKRVTGESQRRVLLAMLPPLVGAAWATWWGTPLEAFITALLMSFLLAIPYRKTILEQANRVSEAGLRIPTWIFKVLPKAGNP